VSDAENKLLRHLRSPKGLCPPLEAFAELVEGDISAEDRALIDGHVQLCPSCQERLNDLRETLSFARQGSKPPRAFVEEAKRILIAPQATDPQKALSPGLTPRFRAAWETLRDWLTPGSFGQWASLAATALLALMIWNSFLREYFSSSRGAEIPLSLSMPTPQRLERLASELTLSAQPQRQLDEGAKGGPVNDEVFTNAVRATVLVVTEKLVGSGAVISTKGEVLTNWHLVNGAEMIVVAFKPKEGERPDAQRGFTARVVKADPTTDLALLQMDSPPQEMLYLRLGSLRTIDRARDVVYAIGHPTEKVWTYTTGMLSQVLFKQVFFKFEWQSGTGTHTATILQTQTQKNPGNAGGPLLNDRGELIGLHSLRADDARGINYAVAIDTIKAFLASPLPVVPPSPPQSSRPPYKQERIGTNIVGVYTDATAPLPSTWFVYRDAAHTTLAYAVKALRTPTRVDTVIVTDGSPATTFLYNFDTDCDGVVDLIGQASGPSGKIERYERPTHAVPLSSLAEEFVAAVRAQTLGHNELRICTSSPS
jgi:S1-C subfamily serine protease